MCAENKACAELGNGRRVLHSRDVFQSCVWHDFSEGIIVRRAAHPSDVVRSVPHPFHHGSYLEVNFISLAIKFREQSRSFY
jgi:hypothetical protein